jgi:hypothetical protein
MTDPSVSWHVTAFATNINSNSGTLFTQSRRRSVFVLESVGLVNTSSQSGDSVLLVVGPGLTGFHSGNVGAGSLDRFPWQGLVVVAYGYTVGWTAGTGTWAVYGAGHYEPAPITS